MNRLAIVGGGVIGLSLAYEMSARGWDVTILDVGEFGRQASWAGAGILPPSNAATAIHPLEHLEALSTKMHRQWATQLLQETGLNNELRRCGALHLARTPGDRASLTGSQHHWTEHEIQFEKIADRCLLDNLGPSFQEANSSIVFVPDEAQIRNPCHLEALIRACQLRNVRMLPNVNPVEFNVQRNQLTQLRFQSLGETNSIDVDAVCIASGAWSGQLVKSLGLSLPMVPVRGQIVLFKLEEQLFEPTTYEGARYIVARSDGHVVVGATVEEVGFDSSTTESELLELRRFAASIYPALSDDAFVKGWAGLRPATYDGFPYIGRLPNLENAFVAAGHFRSGLHLSTGTAAVISDLIVGKQPEVNLDPFDPGRIALVSKLDENQLDIETR